jgi:hypothetical protein
MFYLQKTISFDSYLGIEGSAMLVSPLNEDIIIIIKQNGQLLNFNAEAEITYSGRKQHEGSVVFSHNGSYRKFYTSIALPSIPRYESKLI